MGVRVLYYCVLMCAVLYALCAVCALRLLCVYIIAVCAMYYNFYCMCAVLTYRGSLIIMMCVLCVYDVLCMCCCNVPSAMCMC
jgi:hypothetical protein